MNIISKLLIGIGLGLIIVSTIKTSETKRFTVVYYDWTFLYINSPDFLAAADAGEMSNTLGNVIAKKISMAQAIVSVKKKVVVIPLLDDIEDLPPLMDATSDLYAEMEKIKEVQ